MIVSQERLKSELEQERRLNVTLTAKLILRERTITKLHLECAHMERTRVYFALANFVTLVGLAYFAIQLLLGAN